MNKEYEYAGFKIRFLAMILDLIIFSAVAIPLMIAIYGSNAVFSGNGEILGVADVIINFILPVIYSVLMWHFKSATFGKILLKIKIVDEQTGNKPTIFQSLGRYIGYIVSTIPLFIGFIWIAFDSKKQGWHDKISKTVVIRKKKVTDDVSFSN